MKKKVYFFEDLCEKNFEEKFEEVYLNTKDFEDL